MTVQDALRKTQGRDAGSVNRASVNYAEAQIQPEEDILTAVVANITTRRGHFPGVVVLTDQRVLAVCGLPGIKRCVAIPMNELEKCDETSSFLNYKAVFHGRETDIALTVDPEVGERFSRCLAVRNGDVEEFDAVSGADKGSLLNPTLLRNMERKRRAGKKEAARRKAQREADRRQAGPEGDGGTPLHPEEAPEAVALRLDQQLEQAKKQGTVADTDPRAVAARLARELAENQDRTAE